MSRASNRKIAGRQAAPPAARSVTNIKTQARSQLALLTGLEPVGGALQSHEERYIAACPARPGFPMLDGPASLLDVTVLVGLTKALVGDNPAAEEIAVLSRALDGTIPGVAGSVVAGALIDAARLPDLRELPTEVHRQCAPVDSPLEILAAVGVVAPGVVLRAGLSILTALIRLTEIKVATSSRQAA